MGRMLDFNLLRKRFEAVPKYRTEAGCLLWGGARDHNNYGTLSALGRIGAHRAAWMLENKCAVPRKMVIMHICDNPPCVEITHLKLGTYSDNTQDMLTKGRGPYMKAVN